jgi:hypothetical protein
MSVRALVGLVVLGLGAWALVLVFRTPPPPAEPRVWHSSRQCQECHAQVVDEWQGSWHAQAWTDPEVRALSNDFSNKDCIDCHAPRPVFETGPGQRVLPRAVRQVEGVDCIACHMLVGGPEDGRMAASVTNDRAACRPFEKKELVRPEFCAPCHDQHGTVQQWRASSYAVPGPGYQDCLDCHMPPRLGGGRDHTMHAAHDPELIRRAVVLRGERVAEGWRIEVENVGAGHNFPTDERSRAADLMWRPVVEGGGEEKWRQLYRFRNPYRYEVGLPNTELAAGATASVVLEQAEVPPAPDGQPRAVEVVLFYKLSPFFVDSLYDLSPYYGDFQQPDRREDAVPIHRLILEP